MGHSKGKLMKMNPTGQSYAPCKKKCHQCQQEIRLPQQYGKQAFCKSIQAYFRSNTIFALKQHKKYLVAYVLVFI